MDHAVCDHFLKDGGSFTQQAVRLDVSDIFSRKLPNLPQKLPKKLAQQILLKKKLQRSSNILATL